MTRYSVRTACASDLPALAAIKPPPALHKDRLRDADGTDLLYLALETEGQVIGFGLLVFRRPSTWPDAGDASRLPAMVDLVVEPARRSQGAGSFLIDWMETTVRSRGGDAVYLGVDPVQNKRALQLYRKLGYEPLQAEPYRSHWKFTDSDGRVHEGNDWNIDMVKRLAPRIGQ